MPEPLTDERLAEIRELCALWQAGVDFRTAEGLPSSYAERDFVTVVPVLLAEVERLRGELDRLIDVKLKRVQIEDGRLDATMHTWIIPHMAEALATAFDEAGGVNFVEWTVNHAEKGPLTLTLQRQNGKTPAELKREAEEECERLRKDNERLRAENAELHRHLYPPSDGIYEDDPHECS